MGKDKRKDVRTLAIAMTVVLGGIGVWQIRKGHSQVGISLVVIAALFLLLGIFAPRWLEPFHHVWTRFAFALGYVNTRIILSLFFYLIMTPVGVLRRLLGRDAMSRNLDRSEASYWLERENRVASRESFERQF